MKLFSQRHAKPHERYSYALPEKVRSRILHTLKQLHAGWMGNGQFDFGRMLGEVGEQLLARFGSIKARSSMSRMEQDVLEHFVACSDEEALDFIELCFQTQVMWGDSPEARLAVQKINTIFEEEGIGYELTPPQLVETGETGNLFGRPAGKVMRTEYPRIIKKDDKTTHEIAVKPALELLRDSRFTTANGELLDAFEKIRKGNYADAITSCGSAFESVMKTIYDLKKWAYDPKDACAALVDIGRVNGLFWPFYTEQLKGVGIIRNNLGDAHGKGPAPKHKATREHAEHMIALTCCHITFLIRQAAL